MLSDQCPTDIDFAAAAEELDEKIDDYGESLAFKDYLCAYYDGFLKTVQTPFLPNLTGTLSETRILGVLEPLTDFDDKTDVANYYITLTNGGQREEFISSKFYIGTAYREICGLDFSLDQFALDSFNLFKGVNILQEELAD